MKALQGSCCASAFRRLDAPSASLRGPTGRSTSAFLTSECFKSSALGCSLHGSASLPANPLQQHIQTRSRPLCRHRPGHDRGRLRVRALDAAMPFDYEHIQRRHLEEQGRLKVGLLGFGNFGQFLARRILKYQHTVIAWNRSDCSDVANEMGVRYFRDINDFCEDHPDVVILSTSILSVHKVLEALPVQRLRRSTLFVDVLSVKEFPKTLMLQMLPPGFDVLCTHPMFGPESGKGSWEGLPFVFEQVRVGADEQRQQRCSRFLEIFEREGCRMVEMSCEEHDRYAAGTQFVTHTVGRVLGKLGLQSTPINTKGYETLLKLVENTAGDSFDLYYGLFMYNTNATEELQRLESAFDAVKKQLLDQLHGVLREQLLGTQGGTHSGGRQKALPAGSSSQPQQPRLLESSSMRRHGAQDNGTPSHLSGVADSTSRDGTS